MKKQYRVGIVGFEHMHIVEHVQYLLKKKDRFIWVGGAKTSPERCGQSDLPMSAEDNLRRCQELGVIPTLYDDYRELFLEKPDIVIIGSENSMHMPIVCEFVKQGIHVLVDKPLAYTMEDAKRMLQASQNGGGQIITNWPIAWKSSVRLGKKLLSEGAVGEVLRIHFHNPDSLGPFCHVEGITDDQQKNEWWYQKACGGGSLIDYCSYGCNVLIEYMEKKPNKVFAVTKNFVHPYSEVEDYAGLMLQFDSAVGWIEGSWSTYSSGIPTGPVVWGTKGALIVDYSNGFQVDLYQERFSRVPTHSFCQEDECVPRSTSIEEEVLHVLDTSEAVLPMLGLQRNLEIAAILEAAIKSSESKKMEEIHYE